jgi:hypothetical protein
LETIKSQLPPIELPKQEVEEVEEVRDEEGGEQTRQPKMTKEEKRKQRHDRLLQSISRSSFFFLLLIHKSRGRPEIQK